MQIFHILQKKISTKHCCNKWEMENFHFRPWKTVIIFQLKKTDPVIAMIDCSIRVKGIYVPNNVLCLIFLCIRIYVHSNVSIN